MSQPQPNRLGRVRFGPFEFDGDTLELKRGGEHVPLRPKPSLALELLLRNAGSLVTPEALQEHVWPDTIIEFDQGLNTCIRYLRAALGDDAESPTYIETVPRRGYRFAYDLAASGHHHGRHRWPWAAAGLVTVGVLWMVPRGDPGSPSG